MLYLLEEINLVLIARGSLRCQAIKTFLFHWSIQRVMQVPLSRPWSALFNPEGLLFHFIYKLYVGFWEQSNVTAVSVKNGEYIVQLVNCKLLKKDFALHIVISGYEAVKWFIFEQFFFLVFGTNIFVLA